MSLTRWFLINQQDLDSDSEVDVKTRSVAECEGADTLVSVCLFVLLVVALCLQAYQTLNSGKD